MVRPTSANVKSEVVVRLANRNILLLGIIGLVAQLPRTGRFEPFNIKYFVLQSKLLAVAERDPTAPKTER